MNELLKSRLYELVTSRPILAVARPLGLYPVFGSHSRQLLELIKVKQISCVLDVGAHYGEFGGLLRKIGYRGTILSFEPCAESYEMLTSRTKPDPKWKTFNFALGSSESNAVMHKFKSSFYNSVLPASGNGEQPGDEMVELGTETIQIRTLDSIFEEITGEMRNMRILLKMDTQGYDLEVFRGALNSLQRVYAMQSELPGISHYYQGQPQMGHALSEYAAKNFHPCGFFPVHRGQDGVTVTEWDCLFVRSSEESRSFA